MSLVLTLIGPPDLAPLDDSALDRLRHAFAEAKAESGAPAWLDRGRAVDLPIAGIAPETATSLARITLPDLPLDIHVQPAEGRRKKLLVSDMDSTIVTSETLDDLSIHCPNKALIDALTEQSVAGSMGFTESLVKRIALMAGLAEPAFAEAYTKVVDSPGASVLLNTLKRDGVTTALCSGGFAYFVSRVAERLGFDSFVCNDFELKDGVTTGKLSGPICDPDGPHGKVAVLKRLAAAKGLTLDQTAAIGDGSNDIPMLKVAGLGCAWRGRPKVKAEIGCQLNHADLTGLLHLMGYHRDEFVV